MKSIVNGQRIGFVFEKEIPAKTKWYSPAKSITPYVFGIDPNFESMEKDNTEDILF
jgi:hypothetical protein